MDDSYQPGEEEAEHISYLINHALKGHRGRTEALWRALAADKSDTDDEGRWLRSIAIMVEGLILDGGALPIEERGRKALDALGLGDPADNRWQIKEYILSLGDFDDLCETPPVRSPTQIARAIHRDYLPEKSLRNVTKIVTRILDASEKT